MTISNIKNLQRNIQAPLQTFPRIHQWYFYSLSFVLSFSEVLRIACIYDQKEYEISSKNLHNGNDLYEKVAKEFPVDMDFILTTETGLEIQHWTPLSDFGEDLTSGRLINRIRKNDF